MKLSRYRRLRWVLGFVALLVALALIQLFTQRPQLVVYNDLDTTVTGAALRLPGATLPLPPIAPDASIRVTCPATAAGPVELILPDVSDPLPAGWIEPGATANYTLHITPGNAVVVTVTPTLAGQVRRWFR